MTSVAALLDEAPPPAAVHRDRARTKAKPQASPEIAALLDEAPAPHEVQVPTRAAASDDLGAIADAVAAQTGKANDQQLANVAEERAKLSGIEGLHNAIPDNGISIPAGERALASFKGSQVGVYNRLRKLYGDDNVVPVLEGDEFKSTSERDSALRSRAAEAARNRARAGSIPVDRESERKVVNFKIRMPDGKVAWFDPVPDANTGHWDMLGDVADMAGDVVEGIPAGIGAAIGGTAGSIVPGAGTAGGVALGNAAGSVVGSAIRQGVGALLEGDENLTPQDRAIAAGANVVGGLVGEGAGRVGSRLLQTAARPGQKLLGRAAAREAVSGAGVAETRAAADASAQTVATEAQQEAARAAAAKAAADTGAPSAQATADAAKAAAQAANARTVSGKAAATETERLGQQTGIDFTPGQLTGGREQISLERTIASQPGGMNEFAAGDLKRAKQLGNYVDKTVAATAGDNVGANEAASRAGTAYNAFAKKMLQARSAAADKSFAQVTKVVGDKPVMPMNHTEAAVKKVIKDYESVFGTDAADAIRSKLMARLESARARFGRDPDALKATVEPNAKALPNGQRALPQNAGESTALVRPGDVAGNVVDAKTVPPPSGSLLVPMKAFQRELSIFSKAAQGEGALIDGLDRGLDKKISRDIYGALQRDLADAADGAVSGAHPELANAAGALQDARAHYAEMTRAIEGQKNKILTKAAQLVDENGDPETIIPKIASGNTYSTQRIQKTFAVLNRIDPVAARQMRGAVLEEMLKKTAPAGADFFGREGVPYSPKKFATQMGRELPRLKAIFHGDDEGFAAMQKAIQAAKVLGDDNNMGMGNSRTAAVQMFQGLFQAAMTIGPKVISQSPGRTIREAATAVGTKMNAAEFARVFNSPEATKVYLGLAKQPRSLTQEQVIAGVTRIKAILERDRRLFSAGPQTDDSEPLQRQRGDTAVADRGQP
jgi:hypothetical protein